MKLIKGSLELAGILESVDAKLETLKKSKFDAGKRSFEQALGAPDSQREKLFEEARMFLNEAVSLERRNPDRLAASYVYLAFVHGHLNDPVNLEKTFREFFSINFELPMGKKVVGFAGDVATQKYQSAYFWVKQLFRKGQREQESIETKRRFHWNGWTYNRGVSDKLEQSHLRALELQQKCRILIEPQLAGH